jgi:pimeloyl-ACP methyl ester carboxylesterase
VNFKAELVRVGRTLERPVNYALVHIIPPEGTQIDPAKAPIIVVDPRAGHGPGIGGMKKDSQIGVAMAAGHPCYFIGFLPKPMPGQTIEDVCRAEAIFVEDVAARHPAAEGKPVVIANCQAGWQIMMMAALNPHRTGPIMLAGSPLSYWAGVHGKNPMRYLGGTLAAHGSPRWLAISARASSMARTWWRTSNRSTRPTRIGARITTSIRR